MKTIFKKYPTALMIIFAVVFFILVGSLVISNQIEQKIKSSQVASFKLRSGQVSTNLLAGKIHLQDVELIDSADAGAIYIPEINLQGINVFSLVFLGEIDLGEVWLKNPEIRLAKNGFSNRDSSENQSQSKKPKDIHIRRLKITGADVLICKNDIHKRDSLISTRLDIEINRLTTSSKERNYTFKNTGFQEVAFSLADGKCFFSDDLYAVKFDSVHYSSTNQKLEFADFGIKTSFSKYGVARQTNVETDWFDINIPSFLVNNIQLNELLTSQTLIFDDAKADGFKMNAFRDKRWPFPQKPDTKLPMELFSGLPFKIHSNLIAITNGEVTYEERVKDSERAGIIQFKNLSVELKNLSTADRLTTQPTTMIASAKVMGQGVLNVEFAFPNSKYERPYRVSGKLSSMPLESFNPLLTQNAFIKVERGSLNQIAFNFQYDNNESNGDLIFEYDDLKVTLLDREKGSEKKLKSFLVNALVVEKDNLTSEKNFKKGTIHFERDKKKSVFNYWWKSILSGIKSIAIF